jgi:hypothetical protein
MLHEIDEKAGSIVTALPVQKEQAHTLFRHSDLRTHSIIWENLKGSMPDSELKHMELQAIRFLTKPDAVPGRPVFRSA